MSDVAGNRGWSWRRKSDIATLISSVNDGKMSQLHPGGTQREAAQVWPTINFETATLLLFCCNFLANESNNEMALVFPS